MTSQHDSRGPSRRLRGFDYSNTDQVYFVTTCARKNSVPFGDARLSQAVIDGLDWIRREREVRLYAYCLMPDHLHCLLQLGSPDWTLGAVVGSLKRFTTRASWQMGYFGQLWQARFYDHVVRTNEDGKRIAQYIVDNPVRKGLVDETGSYRFRGMPDAME